MRNKPSSEVLSTMKDLCFAAAEYEANHMALGVTELVKDYHATNYAYTLGILHTLIALGYLRLEENKVILTAKGLEFTGDLPF